MEMGSILQSIGGVGGLFAALGLLLAAFFLIGLVVRNRSLAWAYLLLALLPLVVGAIRTGLGIVGAFNAVAHSAGGDADMLAAGIQFALIPIGVGGAITSATGVGAVILLQRTGSRNGAVSAAGVEPERV